MRHATGGGHIPPLTVTHFDSYRTLEPPPFYGGRGPEGRTSPASPPADTVRLGRCHEAVKAN
eukprot:441990-Hanusia_phi.AAC.1